MLVLAEVVVGGDRSPELPGDLPGFEDGGADGRVVETMMPGLAPSGKGT